MPRSDNSIFQSPKTGLFYLVNIKGRGGVVGEYSCESEARAARRMMPEHLRSIETVERMTRPQPLAGCDVGEITG